MILLKNRDRNPSFKKGEYVEINDAGNYPMELSVDGVCKQKTTTGKNLLDYITNLISSGNGLTSVINEDGSITTTGKPTRNYSTIIKTIDITDILEDGQTYTISQGNASDKVYIQVGFKAVDGTYTRITSARGSKSFEVNKTIYTNYSIMLQTNTISSWGDSSLTITNKYMLCKGTDTADTSFEPYTGGQPSPSPDYPQEIKTITGNLKLTSCGKNLYFNDKDVHSFTPSTGGWKFLDGNGGADSSESNKTIYKAKVEKDKTYTFIANIKSSASISSALMYDGNQKVVSKSGENITYSHTFIAKKSAYVLLRNYVNSGVSVEISNVMLVEGQATPYEPYQGSSLNITIPSNEFVAKLDDTYKDTLNVIYKDDGNYHLILNKMIGKIVLNGSETFYINAYAQTLGYNIFVYKGLTNSLANGDNSCKSNYFIHYSWGQFDSKDAIYQNSNWIMFKCDSLNIGNDIDKFKEWLSTHNTEVYYPLATPYEIDLGIVDTLLSYDEVTNVFSDSDLLPVINAKYYKDFKFDKILRSGYNIDEQEYEIAKKQMANGKRKRILSSYDDCIIKINLGLLDNKTYQEYKEQLDDGEFHYWSYKYNQYKKANFILTKPSITTEYAYDDDIGIDDIEITLEKSSDVS